MITQEQFDLLAKDHDDLKARFEAFETRTDERLQMIGDYVLEDHQAIKKLVSDTAEALRMAAASMEMLVKVVSKTPPPPPPVLVPPAA